MKPLRSLIGGGTVEVHIDPYDYKNDIRANLGYQVMFSFLCDTLQNPGCIGILLSHHHAHCIEILVTDFVLLACCYVLESP